MNRLIWLLAMYVLVLTGLPCPDAACHAHAVEATNPASHTDNDEHEAPCSPFCRCATCAGFTVPQPVATLLPAQPAVSLCGRLVFAYQPIRHEDVAYSFWQPPRP